VSTFLSTVPIPRAGIGTYSPIVGVISECDGVLNSVWRSSETGESIVSLREGEGEHEFWGEYERSIVVLIYQTRWALQKVKTDSRLQIAL
jgi:hypothetical protein